MDSMKDIICEVGNIERGLAKSCEYEFGAGVFCCREEGHLGSHFKGGND